MCARVASFSSRWFPLCLVLALCIFSPPLASAQTVSGLTGSNDKLTSIEESLTDSLSASAQLRTALKERKLSRLDLEIAYEGLKASRTDSEQKLQTRIDDLTKLLGDSVTLSDSLRAEIARLTALLNESKADSAALSLAFDGYRSEMKLQVKQLIGERDTWKVVAIVAIIVAAGAGVYAAVK